MPMRTTLLALLFCATALPAAELKTLKGEVVKGDVVSVSPKEVVIKTEGGDKTYGIKEIASVDFAPKAPALPAAFHDVELVDGTLLHCTDLQFKGTDFTAKLAGGEVTAKV